MILNRKRIICAVAAVALLAGCQKVGTSSGGGGSTGDLQRVPITFSSNMLGVDTKASLNGLNESHDLYIYGLNRSSPGIGEIINAKAHMAKPFDAEDEWSRSEGDLKFADGKTFFYNATRDVYEFFGYYVGDAAEIPEKLTGYQLDVTIDGTQDVLIGVAYPEVDITAPSVNPIEVQNTDYVYSAWSTRRGVTPTLEFTHALTQYAFEVMNRGTQPVVLQSIEITSKTQGTLTVINQDPSSEGAGDGLVQGLVVKSDDTDTKLSLVSSTFVKGGALLDPKGDGSEDDVMVDGVRLEALQTSPLDMQGEIMTFAGQENKVVLKLVQQGMPQGQYRQIVLPIVLDEETNHGTTTKPGYSYKVSLVIYSLENVGINISLIPWQNGGDIPLDQEEEAAKPGTEYEDEIYTDGQV